MKTIIGSTLTLWVLSLFHALPVAAQTQSPVKVGVVLNFAADGGAAGFLPCARTAQTFFGL